MFRKLAVFLVVVCAFVPAGFAHRSRRQMAATFFPSPLIPNLEIWGQLSHDEKIVFYVGWAGGLFTNARDPGTVALGNCLQDKLNWEQMIAMVDKWHADHREEWHTPFSTVMIEIATAPGSPCAGIKVGR